ncbi:MAG: glycosyltransferase [Cyanobacteriota bacterium]
MAGAGGSSIVEASLRLGVCQSVGPGLAPVLTPLPAPWRCASALLISLLALRYIPWRVGSTLNLDSPLAAGLSVMLLAAELMILSHGLLQIWLSGLGGSDGRQEIEAAAARLAQQRSACPERLPSVAVLVPSYGDPPELIARCLRGCLALDHPRLEVWLLDDSGRPELRHLCRELGVIYLARGERRHAKAGNLNHALRHVRAELIAVFDADVVPLTTFLSRTVGLFADPSVAFVQTPQTYMGADPLMRNLRLEPWLMADEESFYRWIEPTRQRLGAVVCAGTSFVMRHQALLAVGGFETATTSEDLATGIRLVAAGYRGLYVAEKLSAGLAPLTLAAMAVQRCRWASGTLQILRTSANPLTIPGLNPLQRLAFLEGILHWLLVFPFLLLALAPMLLGLVNLAPLRVEAGALLTIALPFYGSQLVLIRWLSDHSRSALMPELYRWVLAVPLATTVWAVLRGEPTQFRVTPKEGGIARGVGAQGQLLWPLLVALALQLAAGLQLGRQLVAHGWGALPLSPGSTSLLVVGLAWALLNGLLLLVAIRSCWDRPREDSLPWLAPQLSGWLAAHQGDGEAPMRVCAISEAGCELLVPGGERGRNASLKGVGPWQLRLDHPLLAGDGWPVQLVCLSRRRTRGRGLRVGLRWGALSAAQRERLEAYLYRRPDLWPTRRAPWDPLALAMVGRRLLQRIEPEGWFCRSLLPIR